MQQTKKNKYKKTVGTQNTRHNDSKAFGVNIYCTAHNREIEMAKSEFKEKTSTILL